MNTKLTLSLEQKVIEEAKKYAREKGESLSGIVENYFKLITGNKKKQDKIEISPLVRSMRTNFHAPPGFDYKKEIEEARAEKYLK